MLYERGDMMKATQLLHNLGQSIWLDNSTRDLLDSGMLKRYIDELSVTGLTSNPTIFDHAIKNSTAAGRVPNGSYGPAREPRPQGIRRPLHQGPCCPFHGEHDAEGTLKALADHGELGTILPADGGDCEEVLAQFAKAGIDVDALAAQLQDEGAKSFVKSWNELMAVITSKSAALKEAVAS
jgi:Transaldolase/Fructose-6-phosphate aldolase